MKIPSLIVRFSAGGAGQRDLASAALLDFDTAAIHEIGDDEWRVFFRETGERDRASAVLRAHGEVAAEDVEAEDWARRSQENLRAITVGSFIVAPPWDLPADVTALSDGPRATVIVIEPSTGFGTAHHATTRLCLRALLGIDLRGKRVLDLGTGSGVLAIAAAKLGALSVLAVDHDPDAIDAARANVTRNAVTVALRVSDLERDPLGPADIVVANLTGATLERSAGRIASLARGGTAIVSGLLTEEASRVRAAFEPHASQIRPYEEEGWMALVCEMSR